jgi:phosphate transport system protein
MDEPVDRLNRNMYKEVVDCGPDPALLEWATRMMLVARALERVGDQVVDIAEQTAFLLTGEMMEFNEDSFPGGSPVGG